MALETDRGRSEEHTIRVVTMGELVNAWIASAGPRPWRGDLGQSPEEPVKRVNRVVEPDDSVVVRVGGILTANPP